MYNYKLYCECIAYLSWVTYNTANWCALYLKISFLFTWFEHFTSFILYIPINFLSWIFFHCNFSVIYMYHTYTFFPGIIRLFQFITEYIYWFVYIYTCTTIICIYLLHVICISIHMYIVIIICLPFDVLQCINAHTHTLIVTIEIFWWIVKLVV